MGKHCLSRLQQPLLAVLIILLSCGLLIGVQRRRLPEPRYQGKPLSWWFTRDPPRLLNREQLLTLGPQAVDWLAYQASLPCPSISEGSRLDVPARNRLTQWVQNKLPHRSAIDAHQIRFESIWALHALGPEAAGAIPALLKIASDEHDFDAQSTAAEALTALGPASWPGVRDTILHGTSKQRELLIQTLPRRFSIDAPPQNASEYSEAVSLLLTFAHDSAPYVRGCALRALDLYINERRGHPELRDPLRASAEQLPELSLTEQKQMLVAFGMFNLHLYGDGLVMVPALSKLTASDDLELKVRALALLTEFDRSTPAWANLLRPFAVDKSKGFSDIAEGALVRVDRSTHRD